MKLINTKTLELEEFLVGGSQAPNYAILSHTWAEGEVTLQDFINPDKHVRCGKPGWGKIKEACALARADALSYAWVDTCCIDKTSSAELSEAINSMFQWYGDAAVCYAWLADLPATDSLLIDDSSSQFKHCRWFTRGWTLQELIAPKEMRFYDQTWTLRGSKADLSLALSRITNISHEVLQDPKILYRYPIARRLSWAAARTATRVEDMAYCLIGICDINMPMLYGEGSRAFTRLQEEIVKDSNDLSLFAWKLPASNTQKHYGIFAKSVSNFSDCGSVRFVGDNAFNPDFHLTNKGLRITADLHPGPDGTYLMPLNCSQTHEDHSTNQIGIWVKMRGGGVYTRVKAHELGIADPEQVGKSTKSNDLFVSKSISPEYSAAVEGVHKEAFMFRSGFGDAGFAADPNAPFQASRIEPKAEWDSQRRMFLTHGAASFTAYAFLHSRLRGGSQMFVVAFGKATAYTDPWLIIEPSTSTMLRYLGDLKKLGAIASQRENRGPKVVADFRKPFMQIGASMEKTVVDGQDVYCIDIFAVGAE